VTLILPILQEAYAGGEPRGAESGSSARLPILRARSCSRRLHRGQVVSRRWGVRSGGASPLWSPPRRPNLFLRAEYPARRLDALRSASFWTSRGSSRSPEPWRLFS